MESFFKSAFDAAAKGVDSLRPTLQRGYVREHYIWISFVLSILLAQFV